MRFNFGFQMFVRTVSGVKSFLTVSVREMGQLSEMLIGHDIPAKVGQVFPVFDATALPFVDGHF